MNPPTPEKLQRVWSMSFASVYPLYVQKAQRKGRTPEEVDQVIFWLTGYDKPGLDKQVAQGVDFETFFNQAPAINHHADKITGMICGERVEEIQDPVYKKVRYLDKLIDELAKGKTLEKIFRV